MAISRRSKLLLACLLLPLVVVALAARADRPADEVSARWTTPDSKFADVLGMKVHYRDEGKGPSTVLLIHLHRRRRDPSEHPQAGQPTLGRGGL